jgi:hypothetical protein
MNDNQEDQLSMKRTLLAIRETNSAAIAAIPDLDSDFDDLQTEVDAVNTLIPDQTRTTTGVTRDKEQQEHDLVEIALVVAGALGAFASKSGNNTLFDEVKVSKSKLEHERDQELANTCRFIHGRATANSAALVSRGITPTVLTNFMTEITDYEAIEQSPREATVGKSTATAGIATHMSAGLKIVKERLDLGMRVFLLSNPTLFTSYTNARKIVATGRRHLKNVLSVHVQDADGNPVAGVLVTAGGVARSTDIHGNAAIKGLAAGSISAQLTKPEWIEQFVNSTITDGQTSTVTVTLVKAVGTVSGHVASITVSGPFNVTVQGQAGGATTDGSANYTLTDVPVGNQTIVCQEASNPANMFTQTVMVTAGGTVTVNFMFA